MEYQYTCSLSGHSIPNDLQYSIPVTIDIPDSVTREELIRVCLGTSTRVTIAVKMGKQPKECPKWAMFGYKTTWAEVYSKVAGAPVQPVDNLMAMTMVEFVDDTLEKYPKECDGKPDMALAIYAEKHRREYEEVKAEYEELNI